MEGLEIVAIEVSYQHMHRSVFRPVVAFKGSWKRNKLSRVGSIDLPVVERCRTQPYRTTASDNEHRPPRQAAQHRAVPRVS